MITDLETAKREVGASGGWRWRDPLLTRGFNQRVLAAVPDATAPTFHATSGQRIIADFGKTFDQDC
jgi:hypothetical protein